MSSPDWKRRGGTLLLVLGLAFGAGVAWEQLSQKSRGAGAAPGSPAPSPSTLPDQDEMFETTLATGRAILVYGGGDPALSVRYREALEAYVRNPRGLLRRLAITFATDAEAPPDTLTRGLALLFGTPRSNAAIKELGDALPVRFTAKGFELFGRDYDDPGDVVSVSIRNPRDPRKLMLVLAANDDEAILEHLKASDRGIWRSDYVVWRGGEVIRSGEWGTDAGGQWTYDPALDQDRLGWTEDYQKNIVAVERGSVRLLIPARLASGVDVNAMASQLDERVRKMAARLGLADVTPPITIRYYPDTEWKGKLTGEVVDEHADPAGMEGYRVYDPARPLGDGIAEAEALLHRTAGVTSNEWLNAGSILWLCGSWLGIPIAEWPGRLEAMGVWLKPESLVRAEFGHHSYYFTWPAAGAFVTAFVERHGVAAWRDLYEKSRTDPELRGFSPEAMPDPAPRPGGIPGRSRLDAATSAAAAAFDRGVCYAHDYSLDNGYASEKSRRNLDYLKTENHVNAISISPFGYISSAHDPEIGHRDRVRGRGGNSEENDESLIAATGQAHRLGMKVMLSPHLWGRVWCGEWGAESEDQWPAFFEEYRCFILHYAALAEAAGCDLFMVGKELSATASRSAEWRDLIRDIRRVYTGPLTYGANWDSEYQTIDWWDAVDYIGISQYTPLSSSEHPSDAELVAGATIVGDRLDELSKKYSRPYLLTEVGFTAQITAARTPWESFDGDAAADLELQARCYDATLRAFSRRPACAGMYWWKWFTYLPSNKSGRNRFDYPPYGKPAETVLRRWYGEIAEKRAG